MHTLFIFSGKLLHTRGLFWIHICFLMGFTDFGTCLLLSIYLPSETSVSIGCSHHGGFENVFEPDTGSTLVKYKMKMNWALRCLITTLGVFFM